MIYVDIENCLNIVGRNVLHDPDLSVPNEMSPVHKPFLDQDRPREPRLRDSRGRY